MQKGHGFEPQMNHILNGGSLCGEQRLKRYISSLWEIEGIHIVYSK